MPTLPNKEEIEAAEKALEPYMLRLGRVAHAWNHMHESLGLLFCTICCLPWDIGMAIWHSLKSDRSQRDLLQGAITAADRDEVWKITYPKAKESVDWALQKINGLADRRNSAIHAPIFVPSSGEPELTPLTMFGNPNAAKLYGKDIIQEFEWYEDYANAIKKYIIAIEGSIGGRGTLPWPDKPVLPTVGQKSSRPG